MDCGGVSIARPSGEKTRCSGQWTEARFTTFVKGGLRQLTRKWGPKQEVVKEARTRRGYYMCAMGHEVPVTIKVDGKRKKNIAVDHIKPIVDPNVGWMSWDEIVEGMFCEKDNLQVLCLDHHKEKCAEETAIAAARRLQEKTIDTE